MNWIDFVVIAALIYSLFQGYHRGLIVGVLSLLFTAFSVYLSVLTFPFVSKWASGQLSVNEQIAPFLSFIVILIIFELLGSFVIAAVDQSVVRFLYKFKPLALSDRILGVIPSTLLMALFVTLIMLLPITVPLSSELRHDIQRSWWGKNVLPKAYAYVPKIERLAHRLPTQSLLSLIPRSPNSNETISLQLPPELLLQVDEESEKQMLVLVNQERTSRGLKPVVTDQTIIPVARAHSKDMFDRKYFSHENPDGETPFDRMGEGGVKYLSAGENLAYAPNVGIAHEGLMNSPGHRANILRPEFGRIGIGVIDGGIYGKMFTQNFAD